MKSTIQNILPPQLTLLSALPGQNENVGGSPKKPIPLKPAPANTQGKTADPAGQKDQGQKPQACQTQMFIMIPLMILIFYFLLIRPQQKQEKQKKTMQGALKKNDKVLTTSGIIATVAAMDEKTVTLKIDEKGDVRVRFDRSAISTILSKGDGSEKK